MSNVGHHPPGEPTPATGVYQQHSIFGTPIERRESLRKGEPLPQLPIGHTWVLVNEEDRQV